MGTLYYGSGTQPITIDDHLLAYLKVLIAVKLRRNESFTLTWKHGPDEAPGRSMIWLQPAIPLRFVFDTETPEALNRAFLDGLVQQSNSTAGVTIDLGAPDVVPSVPERGIRMPALSGAA